MTAVIEPEAPAQPAQAGQDKRDELIAELLGRRQYHSALLEGIRREGARRQRLSEGKICHPGFKRFLSECFLGDWDELGNSPHLYVGGFEVEPPDDDVIMSYWSLSAEGLPHLLAIQKEAYDRQLDTIREKIKSKVPLYISQTVCNHVLGRWGMAPVRVRCDLRASVTGTLDFKASVTADDVRRAVADAVSVLTHDVATSRDRLMSSFSSVRLERITEDADDE